MLSFCGSASLCETMRGSGALGQPMLHRRVHLTAHRRCACKSRVWVSSEDPNRSSAQSARPTRESALKAYAPLRVALWALEAGYFGLLFLSDIPPGPSIPQLIADGGPDALRTLQEALDLSLNFWFILPLTFPSSAPVIHPALEALFNLIVTWGLLCFGFIRDGRNQRVPMLPFLFGTAFLTNVFLVPYLALRNPFFSTADDDIHVDGAAAIARVSVAGDECTRDSTSRLESVCESRAFGVVLGLVGVSTLAWFCWGRGGGGGGEYGGVIERAMTLWSLCTQGGQQGDRLAASFAVDACVFWLLQAWLIPDDLRRRRAWTNPPAKKQQFSMAVARFVPFFGVVYHLVTRPKLDR